jgi:hypothetical protein
MLGPKGLERNMRVAILIAIFTVVVIAPLIGVYAFSPFIFVWAVQPYQLAVALSVMLAQALCIAALVMLIRRSKR